MTQQQREALELANAIRMQCACLKRSVKAEDTVSHDRLIEVLLDPPEYAAKVKVFDLLLCGYKIGPQKARTIMRKARMVESWTVGEITIRQRAALRAVLMGEEIPVMWPAAA